MPSQNQDDEYDIDYETYIFHKQFQLVIPEQSSAVPRLRKYWIAAVNPKQSGAILKLIKDTFQYTSPDLRHVKRIQKVVQDGKARLHVIICPVNDKKEDELKAILAKAIGEDRESIQLQQISIPMNKPFKKELNTEWSEAYWPIIWKGNPLVQELHALYKDFDLKKTTEYIRQVCSESAKSGREVPVISMFVDPEMDTVMSIKTDERTAGDPMRHSILCCIEEIAGKELERRHTSEDSEDANKYLCLKYDVYTSHEPCTMCAMALLHSRIRRLVYVKASPQTGAIGKSSGCGYMVHLSCTLNWKYESFQYLEPIPTGEVSGSIHV